MTHYTFQTDIGPWAASSDTEEGALAKVLVSVHREPRPKFHYGDRVYLVNRAGEIIVRDTVITWTEWADDIVPSSETDLATGEPAAYFGEYFYGLRDPHPELAHAPRPTYREGLIRPYAEPDAVMETRTLATPMEVV